MIDASRVFCCSSAYLICCIAKFNVESIRRMRAGLVDRDREGVHPSTFSESIFSKSYRSTSNRWPIQNSQYAPAELKGLRYASFRNKGTTKIVERYVIVHWQFRKRGIDFGKYKFGTQENENTQ